MASDAHVQRLVLTRLSSRYDVEPQTLLKHAKEANTSSPMTVAYDGFSLEVPLPP